MLKTTYNGQTQTSATYDYKGKLSYVGDGVTKTSTAYEYDVLDRVKRVNVGNVTETTEYDEYGNVSSKTRTENGNALTYTYAYKNNAARVLESVSVGDICVKPQSDCLGRSTGKTIAFNGVKVAEESIAYRKVGDHATNMPSTIRFGNRIVTPSDASDPSVISTEASNASGAEKSTFVLLDSAQKFGGICK